MIFFCEVNAGFMGAGFSEGCMGFCKTSIFQRLSTRFLSLFVGVMHDFLSRPMGGCTRFYIPVQGMLIYS